jgi:hypothetical protein
MRDADARKPRDRAEVQLRRRLSEDGENPTLRPWYNGLYWALEVHGPKCTAYHS